MELKLYIGKHVFESIEDFMTLEEFYKKVPEWISEEKEKWNHITLMAYFTWKYEQANGVRYRMSRWKNNPAKSKESLDMSKILKIFKKDSSSWTDNNQKAVIKCYNYINWAFDSKFKFDKKINSTGLLLNHSLINEFEKIYVKKLKEHLNKNKLLKVLSWIKNNEPNLLNHYDFNDLNDINIFINFVESNEIDEDMSEKKLYNYLKSEGV